MSFPHHPGVPLEVSAAAPSQRKPCTFSWHGASFSWHGARSLALGLLLALAATAASAQGDSLRCLGGERLSVAELRQGTTIAVFWASWSPRSRDVVDRINALAAKWGSRARVVAINYQEDPEEVRRFLAGRSLNVPVCFDVDGSFSKGYEIATLPGLVVVRNGEVARRGRLPDDADGVIAEALH